MLSLTLSLEQPPFSHSFSSIFSFLPTFLLLKLRSHLSQKKKMSRKSKRQVALITGKRQYCSNTVLLLLLAHCNGTYRAHTICGLCSLPIGRIVSPGICMALLISSTFFLLSVLLCPSECVCVCVLSCHGTQHLPLSPSAGQSYGGLILQILSSAALPPAKFVSASFIALSLPSLSPSPSQANRAKTSVLFTLTNHP